MSEWQPIETAPRDETPVLTRRGGDLMAVAIYLPKAGDWPEAWQGGWLCTDGIGLLNVTHWMPLPEPPK
jgi:hypothetical protein